MIRLTVKIFVMFLVAGSVYALICARLLSVQPQSTPDIYNQKSLIVQRTPEPRIILIGGSNVLYGIDSEALKAKMGMSVINMGLTADLGLRFMIEFSKDYLKPGDVVVFSPEYEHLYDKNNYYGTFRLIDLLTNNPGSARLINTVEHKFHLLLLAPTALISRTLYGAHSLNPPISDAGDFLWNEISLQNKVKLPKGGVISGSDFSDIFSELVGYRESLLARNIKLYLSFPYVPSGTIAANRDKLDRLYRRFISAGFDVLSPPESCTASELYFYDTVYHLNAVGRILRTDQLAAQLQARLSR